MDEKLVQEIKLSDTYTSLMIKNTWCLRTVAYYDNENFTVIPRYPHVIIGDRGTIYDIHRRWKLMPVENYYGYLNIDTLDLKYGRVCHCFIHRLVMMAFRPIPNDDEMQVEFIDGNIHNTHLFNLRWVECDETVDQRMTTGMTTSSALFSIFDIRRLCFHLNKGLRIKDAVIAAGLEYNHPTKDLASRICRGLLYTDLLKEYPNIIPSHVNRRRK